MPRTLTFDYEAPYERRPWGSGVQYQPEVIAEFRVGGGRPWISPAILDTGAPWCCIPRTVAQRLGVDIASCPTRPTIGIEGRADAMPYARMRVTVLGLEQECDVLLIAADLFLIGREPFFSAFQFAFHQESDPDRNRILYRRKQ